MVASATTLTDRALPTDGALGGNVGLVNSVTPIFEGKEGQFASYDSNPGEVASATLTDATPRLSTSLSSPTFPNSDRVHTDRYTKFSPSYTGKTSFFLSTTSSQTTVSPARSFALVASSSPNASIALSHPAPASSKHAVKTLLAAKRSAAAGPRRKESPAKKPTAPRPSTRPLFS